MPVVCINRPNRTAPRHFKAADVERIVRYATRTSGRIELFAAFLRGSDMEDMVCGSYRAIEALITFRNALRDFEVTKGTITTLGDILLFIVKGCAKMPWQAKAAIAGVATIYVVVKNFTNLLDSSKDFEIQSLLDFLAFLQGACPRRG